MRKNYLLGLFLTLSCMLIPNSIFSQREATLGSIQSISASSSQFTRADQIDNTHILYVYRNGTSASSDIVAVIGEVNTGTGVITLGTPFTVVDGSTTANRYTSVTVLSSTLAIISYERDHPSGTSSDTGYSIAVSLNTSTNTVSSGSTAVDIGDNIDSAFSHNPISMVRLTDTTFAVLYSNDNSTDNGTVRIGTYASGGGGSITYGTAQEFDTGDVQNLWITALSESKIAVSYEDDGSSDRGRVIIGDISGTTVTWGTETTFNDAATTYTAVQAINATQFVVCYIDDDTSDYLQSKIGTVSGTAVTYSSSEFTIEGTQTSNRDISIDYLDGNEFVVAFHAGASSDSKTRTGRISGTGTGATIAYNTADTFLGSQADGSWVTALGSDNFVIGFVDDDDADHAEAIVGSLTTNTSTWSGATDTHWEDPTNWSDGVPTKLDNASIPSVGTLPEIHDETAGQVRNLTIASGATLTVNGNNSITINGDLTTDGTLLIKSNPTTNGSMILAGSYGGSGSVNYERELEGSEWHLISSPVSGQSISAFSGVVATSGVKYGIAPYDNSNAAGSRWEYYTTGAGSNNIASAGSFTVARGYSIQKSTAGTITLSGTPPTADIAYAITDNSGGTGNKWNLVGNPFPAFIPANSGADATNNFLTVNSADLDPARVAIYVWNPAGAGSYTIINHASAATYIAPGQAFFIESIDSGASVDFTKVMQSHQTGDLFLKQQNTIPQIDVMVTDNTLTKATQIKYIDGKTTGLDLGWDAGVFGGVSSSFNIFTHLVTNSKGTDFALQVLPDTDYESTVIPIGVKADAGKELTFTVNAQQLPSGLKVFLEDRETATFTRLDVNNASYKTTLQTALTGIGRFYLHTKAQVLDTPEETLAQISIYTTSRTNLRIAGLNSTNVSLAMFNMLGKQITRTSFQSSGVSDIQLPQLATGIYIVHLQTPFGKLSKKIIIK